MIFLAGWFDLGLGRAVEAVSDATFKVILVRAIERLFPSIILLTCIVGTIVSAWGMAYLLARFHESVRAALRDDRVTAAEWVLVGFSGLLTLAVGVFLGWFSFLLMRASQSGLAELMK